MHPLAALHPIDVAWRDLWHGDKGDAGIAHIGQTDRIPGGFCGFLLAVQARTNIVRRGRDHAFDHKAGLGYTGGHGGRLFRRDGDRHTNTPDIAMYWVALVLINDDKAFRINQPFNALHCLNTSKSGQHHGVTKGQLMALFLLTIFIMLYDMHDTVFDLLYLSITDPINMTLT